MCHRESCANMETGGTGALPFLSHSHENKRGHFGGMVRKLKSLFHFGKLLYLGLAKLEAMGLKVGCNLSTPPGLKEPELDPGRRKEGTDHLGEDFYLSWKLRIQITTEGDHILNTCP